MRVDVVIVAFRSEHVLLECIESVIADPHVATVTVVDHGDGRSAAVARELHAAEVVALHDESNPGFGSGQNRGAACGRAEAILALNPDARMMPGALSRGVDVLKGEPTLAAVQGVIRDADSQEPERSQGRALGPLHLVGRALGLRWLLRRRPVRGVLRAVPVLRDHVDRRPVDPTAVESLAATALLIRRTAFESVEGFDESYFLYGEDLDLCRRLRETGWTLVALPDEWAIHRSGSSSRSFVDREIAWWSGTLRFAAASWSMPAFLVALLSAAVMELRLLIAQPRRWSETMRILRDAVATRRRLTGSVS